MSNYRLADLIESVKYGEAAPAYGGDLQADLLRALDDIEQLRDLVELYHEAFPKAGDFESLGAHLFAHPKAFAEFSQLIKQWQATLNSLKTDAESLNIEIDL